MGGRKSRGEWPLGAGKSATYGWSQIPVQRSLSMIPTRYAPILFGFLLSGMMSFLVSGLSTFRAIGLVPAFGLTWFGNWGVSWAIAFPVVLVVAPITRRLVARLTVTS